MNERSVFDWGLGANTLTKPKTLKNYVAIILDGSGSMGSLRDSAINMFNEQIVTIKNAAKEQETLVTFVPFNTFVPKPTLLNIPAQEVPEINTDVYIPNGMTALNDAIGITISNFSKMYDANSADVSFLIIIISDGYENQSVEYRGGARIKEIIKDKEKTKRWTFTFMGANVDMLEIQRTYGFAQGNISNFVPTAHGMTVASDNITTGNERYFSARREGRRSVNNFYDTGDGLNEKECTFQDGDTTPSKDGVV